MTDPTVVTRRLASAPFGLSTQYDYTKCTLWVDWMP